MRTIPSVLSTQMFPLWCSIICLQIASPKPPDRFLYILIARLIELIKYRLKLFFFLTSIIVNAYSITSFFSVIEIFTIIFEQNLIAFDSKLWIT
jgi:hypothetical protein